MLARGDITSELGTWLQDGNKLIGRKPYFNVAPCDILLHSQLQKACVARRVHSENKETYYTSEERKLIITSNVSGAIQQPSSVNTTKTGKKTTGCKQWNASDGM